MGCMANMGFVIVMTFVGMIGVGGLIAVSIWSRSDLQETARKVDRLERQIDGGYSHADSDAEAQPRGKRQFPTPARLLHRGGAK